MYFVSRNVKALWPLFFIAFLLIAFFGCERSVNINDTGDSLPPVVPQDAAIVWAGDGTVEIDWSPIDELHIKGYNVYRSINDTMHLKLRSFTTSSYFIEDSLDYGTIYYYRISALNNQNIESVKGNWLIAKPVNIYAPITPRELEINARNWEGDSPLVFLKWRINPEGDIAGYNIYRSERPDFNADTNSFAGFSSTYYFTDRKNLQLSKTYYYRIKAVDKGGKTSEQSSIVSDMIFEKAVTAFPAENATVDFFDEFKIKAIKHAANYRIILQTNPLFGEIWSKDFNADNASGSDTISVKFDASGISAGTTYYWRIITFSPDNPEPNSISNLFNFTIKPQY